MQTTHSGMVWRYCYLVCIAKMVEYNGVHSRNNLSHSINNSTQRTFMRDVTYMHKSFRIKYFFRVSKVQHFRS